MTKRIPVILLEDVAGVGEVGQVVEVAEGYARNALFPDGKAAVADAPARKRVAAEQQKKAKAEASALLEHQQLATSIDGTELFLSARVKEGEGGELYAKVSPSAVAKELATQSDVRVGGKDIILAEEIVSVGTYEAVVNVAPDVEAKVRITISAANEEKGDD